MRVFARANGVDGITATDSSPGAAPSYHSDLRLEAHRPVSPDVLRRAMHQALNVRRGGTAEIDNEVGVLLGDPRAPHSQTFEATCIDEPAGMIARRVAEHRAAATDPDRLGSAALPQQSTTPRRPVASRIRGQLELGPDDHSSFGPVTARYATW